MMTKEKYIDIHIYIIYINILLIYRGREVRERQRV